jgi:hypothetical protein
MYPISQLCVFLLRGILIRYLRSVHQMQSEYDGDITLRSIDGDICSPDYAINNRLTPFISMQNHYNLIYREEEREMMPTLKVKELPHVRAVRS